MKILLIKNNDQSSIIIKNLLKKAGFIFDVSTNNKKSIEIFLINNYDLIIIDYIIINKDLREVIQIIKSINNKKPIIVISRKYSSYNLLSLFNAGIDDYINKPFWGQELIARINAITRRSFKPFRKINKLKDIKIDPNKQAIIRNKKIISLTNKEFLILDFLIKNKNKICAKDDIIKNIWDEEANHLSNTLEVHIKKIRKKISNKKRPIIKTFPGKGYMIEVN